VRILFLCASLEPGRDGVGDYTTRLVRELETRGHLCLRIAINDQHLKPASTKAAASIQELAQIRLGTQQSWQERVFLIQKAAQEFQPDWVSLQFVPWGLARRGLPFGLGAKLRAAISNRPLHVMCHELWLTNILPLPLRQRVLGVLQKAAIKGFFAQLHPRFVHTHLEYYRQLLKEIRIESEILPLHGNIPAAGTRAEGRAWMESNSDVASKDKVAGFFGNLWTTFDLSILKKLVGELGASGERFLLFSAGSLAPSGEINWRKIETEFGGLCRVVRLGPLDERSASLFMASLDIGLTTYPAELAGKSGSVAAMLEHGIPVRIVGSLRSSPVKSSPIMPEGGARVSDTAEKLLQAIRLSDQIP
jgi:hypothetical protein